MKKLHILALIFFAFNMVNAYPQLPDKEKKEAKKAYNYAVEYINQGNFENALVYLDSAIKYDKTFIEAHLSKAKAQVELGKINRALESFYIITELEPSLGEPFFYLGYLQLNNEKDSLAKVFISKAIEKGYQKSQAYYYRGLLNLLDLKYPEAIADFTEVIFLDPNNALAYHNRATAKRELGDLQGALRDYSLATDYKHDFPVAFNNLGSVKILLGNYSGAIEDYSVAVNLDSTFYIAYNNRGSAYYFLGDLELALEDFNKAIRIKEEYPHAMNNKASIFASEADYESSVSVFNEIIEINGEFKWAYLNRGLVKELMGDLEGACEDWNKALDMGVDEAAEYVKECN